MKAFQRNNSFRKNFKKEKRKKHIILKVDSENTDAVLSYKLEQHVRIKLSKDLYVRILRSPINFIHERAAKVKCFCCSMSFPGQMRSNLQSPQIEEWHLMKMILSLHCDPVTWLLQDSGCHLHWAYLP